jgi:hypothetical protein
MTTQPSAEQTRVEAAQAKVAETRAAYEAAHTELEAADAALAVVREAERVAAAEAAAAADEEPAP